MLFSLVSPSLIRTYFTKYFTDCFINYFLLPYQQYSLSGDKIKFELRDSVISSVKFDFNKGKISIAKILYDD